MMHKLFNTWWYNFFGIFILAQALSAQIKIKDSVSIHPKATQFSTTAESNAPCYQFTVDGSCGALADANVGGNFVVSAGGCTSPAELIGGCIGGWGDFWNYYCSNAVSVRLTDPVSVQIGNYPVRLVNVTPDRVNDIHFVILVTNPERGKEYGVGLLKYSLKQDPPVITINNPRLAASVTDENKPVLTVNASAPRAVLVEYTPSQTIDSKDFFDPATGEFVIPEEAENMRHRYPENKHILEIDVNVKATDECGNKSEKIVTALLQSQEHKVLLGESKYFYTAVVPYFSSPGRTDTTYRMIVETTDPNVHPNMHPQMVFDEPVAAPGSEKNPVLWDYKDAEGNSLPTGMIRIIGKDYEAGKKLKALLRSRFTWNGVTYFLSLTAYVEVKGGGNHPPIISAINYTSNLTSNKRYFPLNDIITVNAEVSDPDGDEVTVSYEPEQEFVLGQLGENIVKITATDSKGASTTMEDKIYGVGVTITPEKGIVKDGENIAFKADIYPESISASSFEWSWEPKNTPAGNSPKVDFVPSNSQQNVTVDKAWWYAFPDRECPPSNQTSIYNLATVVYIEDDKFEAKGKLSVFLPDTGGSVKPPYLEGTPYVVPIHDNTGKIVQWKTYSRGTLKRILNTPKINLSPSSQFYAKTVAHENVHIQQWTSGKTKNLWTVEGLYQRISGFKAKTMKEITILITKEIKAYNTEQLKIFKAMYNALEIDAYKVGDNIPPKYFYQLCGRTFNYK